MRPAASASLQRPRACGPRHRLAPAALAARRATLSPRAPRTRAASGKLRAFRFPHEFRRAPRRRGDRGVELQRRARQSGHGAERQPRIGLCAAARTHRLRHAPVRSAGGNSSASRHHCRRMSPMAGSRTARRDAGDLRGECGQRQQRLALRRRSEQRREVAIRLTGFRSVNDGACTMGCGADFSFTLCTARSAGTPALAPARHGDQRSADRRGLRPAAHCRYGTPLPCSWPPGHAGLREGAAQTVADGQLLALPVPRISSCSASFSASAGAREGCSSGSAGCPGVNAARQAQDRAAVAHAGEPEAAVAVGIDRRAARKPSRRGSHL